jgi:hypothetical protein
LAGDQRANNSAHKGLPQQRLEVSARVKPCWQWRQLPAQSTFERTANGFQHPALNR